MEALQLLVFTEYSVFAELVVFLEACSSFTLNQPHQLLGVQRGGSCFSMALLQPGAPLPNPELH